MIFTRKYKSRLYKNVHIPHNRIIRGTSQICLNEFPEIFKNSGGGGLVVGFKRFKRYTLNELYNKGMNYICANYRVFIIEE